MALYWASIAPEFRLDAESDEDPAFDLDADLDPNPASQNDADLCGSGSAALPKELAKTSLESQ